MTEENQHENEDLQSKLERIMYLLRKYGAMQKALLYKTQALNKRSYEKILRGISRTSGCLKSNPPIQSSPSKQRYTWVNSR